MAAEIQLPRVDRAVEQTQSSKTSTKRAKVVVCRGRSCRQYQAEKVFKRFEQNLPDEVELMSVPCLGQCGNGTMVVVEPDLIWYSQVHPDEVATIIEQHIVGKTPVKAMLYPKFHK